MLDYPALADRLKDFPRQTIPRDNLRSAAVLLPLFCRDGQEFLLFTVRTKHLQHHSGEISFPGGSREAMDSDLIATARRETEEELRITADSIEILGRMDDFYSIHGYHVVPFVGVIPEPTTLQYAPDEIAAVFVAPVDHFRDPAVHHVEDWSHQGRTHLVDFYRYQYHVIWGLTAAMLRQFLAITATEQANAPFSVSLSHDG